MILAWIAGLAALAGLVLLLPLEFRARFAFRGPGRGDRIVFELGLFGGLSVWRLAVPLVDLVRGPAKRGFRTLLARVPGGSPGEAGREARQAKSEAILSPREVMTAGEQLYGIVLRLVRKTRWRKLKWQTRVGLEDAAATALIAGGLWAVKGNLAAVARSKLHLAPGLPDFDVRADFAGGGVESRLDGIGVLRVGDIIFALPGLALGYYHLWRSGRAQGGATGGSTQQRTHSGRRSSWPSTPFRA